MLGFRYLIHPSYKIVFYSCFLILIFLLYSHSTLAADPENQTIDSKKEKPKTASVTSPLEKTKAAFQARDANQDGRVTEQEFISSFPEDRQAAAGRDFRLFNRDGDDVLSFNEYCSIPGLVPQSFRSSISHPLTPLVEQQLSVIDKHWKQWDVDGNDSLSPEEFENAKINEQISGLPPVVLKDWDRNTDGQISREDCRLVIEACYGLRRLDGLPIQLPTGLVVYWWHFKDLDRDRDDQLTLKEFQAYYNRFGEEDAKRRFQQGDSDGNELITLSEWAKMPGNLIDTVAEFQRMDINLDGQINQQEFRDGVMPFLRPLARYTFPGFDLDHDGQLSLDEFRMTLPINRIENWSIIPRDTDHDGRLSLKEMPWTPGLELSLLRQEYFQCLDVNQNGFLDLDEYNYVVDPTKTPAEIVLKVSYNSRDTNQDGHVSEAEFIASFPMEKQQAAKRDFLLFNRDGDKNLSFDEYRTIPGLTPVELRGELTHPLTALVDKQLSVIEKHWKSWDVDGNDSLSPEEFENAKVNELIPGLPPVVLDDWDRDADSQVSRKDCRQVIEACYGLCRLDGQPLQLPSGLVVYWWHFKDLDRDHNDQLSLKEFQAYYNRFREEAAKKRFQDGDTNHDKSLSLKEWAAMPGFLLDPVAEFQKLDQNLDGRVDQDELSEEVAPFLRPLAQFIFPGFDEDQDGTLSLDEYRLTLLANRVENWDVISRDTDHDGRLSLKEMAWTPGLELSLLRQEYFQRLDLNQDSYLDLDEFKVAVDGGKAPAEIALKAVYYSRDTNRDRRVTETEFVDSFPKEKQPEAKRDFLLFNRDGDDNLSFEEYRSIAGLVPAALRSGLPHPLMPQIQKQMGIIDKHWKQWDADGNNSLSPDELQNAKITEQIPGLPPVVLKDWDRDADGQVSRDDCRQVLEACYGLRRLDGQPLYLPSGQIVYWWHFKNLDRDHNDQLTLEEFLSYYRLYGEEQGKQRFEQGDTDHNQMISLREWAKMPGLLLDPIVEFQKMDLNLDGYLDRDELFDQTAKWLQSLTGYTFPGFDLDHDGKLSLDEYRMTLPANKLENWDVTSVDADHDGRLSLKEMAWTPGLELSLLRQEYFQRLDVNQNGFLDIDEFKVSIDNSKAPAEIVLQINFQSRDANQDGRVTVEEFVASYPREKQPEAKRDFQLFNLDGDDQLSLAEFCTIPGVVPLALRGELPHPLLPLIEKQMAAIESQWPNWDENGDRSLSSDEYASSKLNTQIPGLTALKRKDWDRDRDGKVSLEDCRQVMEAAYGMRRLDGQPLQLPSGLVVYWWHFKDLDRDHNDQLTLKEFQNYYNRFGEEAAQKRFQQGDTDQNETLSLQEWAQMPGFLLDPISEFRKMDANFDGLLNQQELLAGIAPFL
ncbi:MAG TPA: hypothetical protein DCM07_11830, partial [Planctomycetaceae bacterium]|nr:hypothetical protein [Planctomycetaceae bacterium]